MKKAILFEPIKSIEALLSVDARDLSHQARPKYGYDISHTYGEVDCVTLADFLKTAPFNPKPTGIFIDLGCGIGKAVWVAAATLNYDQCIGIEKLDLLAKKANAIQQSVVDDPEWAPIAKKITFQENLIENTDISMAHTVLVNGVCFSAPLMTAIQAKLTTLRPGAHIVSFDKHFESDEIDIIHSELLLMGWGTKARAYLQRKKR